MSNDITITLATRDRRYGEFKDQARFYPGHQAVCVSGKNWHAMPDIQREALEMIASKVARILNRDNNYGDTKLAENDLTQQVMHQPVEDSRLGHLLP